MSSAISSQHNTILTRQDSLEVFLMLDSLMNNLELPSSQLVPRLSYNSNVQLLGRTLGLQQFGLSPGLSYYHHKGFFTDLTTYWTNKYVDQPSFYLTTFSTGYMHLFSKKISTIVNYDHYFYNFNGFKIPYTNAISVAPFLEQGHFLFRVDYSFYFGQETAHRIMPGFSINWKKIDWHGIQKISFSPGVYVLFGDVQYYEVIQPQESSTPNGSKKDKNNLGQIIKEKRIQGIPPDIPENGEVIVHSGFGTLNYTFNFPLLISYKNWKFNLSYSYNIPRAVRDEPLTLSSTGFLSSSLLYTIKL